MRVAYYSPLPPERSGIADYSALLLPALERLLDVEVVRRGRTRPVAADVALYHIGNDPEAHGWIVDVLRRRPGVVVLHDFVLHHLVAGLTIGRKDGAGYLAAMERDAGIPGRLVAHGVLDGRVSPPWEVAPDEFPLAAGVLDAATGLIVHSEYVEERAREAGYEGPISRIPHPAWPPPRVEPIEGEGRPIFGCFGHLNPSKRIPQLLEAFALMRERRPAARLLLVGPASPGFDVDRLLGDGVVREDYVDEERLWSLMAACDACISLRAPTMGETSGSAIRALSLGRPLVVSDVGWFAELPDRVALKIPAGEDEVPALAASMELLAASEAAREAMSSAASAYVEREHDVGSVAELYAAALEEAAGGAAVTDAVVRAVARAAAEVGIGADDPLTAELAARLDEAGLGTNGRPISTPAPPRRSQLARVPVWTWLVLLVLLSALGRYAFSRRVVAPWIMVDELIYSELAKSFAATGRFLIRGDHHGAYGVLYPILIAPAYRLFGSIPDAYAAAKAIGAVVMSLAAIPAYFLARRVLAPAASLLAALLAVAAPSMVYTGTLMTENAFYPLFLCVALALVLALERPSALRQLVLLGVCLLAFLTRTQAIVLVPAVATAPLLLGWIDRRARRTLASFRVLYGVLAAAVVVVLALQLARGRSPYAVVGSYSVTGHAHYRLGDVLRWLLYHVAELDLYLGLLPFAALLVLVTLARRLDRPARIVVVATVSLSVWLVLEVAAFASAISFRVEERNMFYVAPLFLIALLVWIDRGLPRPPPATAVCVAAAAALPALLPFHRLIDAPAESDTLALLPLWWLQEHVIAPSEVVLVVVTAAIVLGALFVLVPIRYALALPALVLAWFVFTQERVEFFDHGFPKASVGALYQGITAPRRDWVDAAVGRKADVAFLYSGARPTEQPLTLWENEFFNRSIGPVYDLRGRSMGELPEAPVRQRDDGLLIAAGQPVRHDYVLTDTSVPLEGRLVAEDALKGAVLLRTTGPLRIAYRTTGIEADDWSGASASYTRLDCRGGRLVVRLGSDPKLGRRRLLVAATSGGLRKSVEVADGASLTIPLVPMAGRCTVRFTATPTAIPAVVEPGSRDVRRLGARFLGFRYVPPSG